MTGHRLNLLIQGVPPKSPLSYLVILLRYIESKIQFFCSGLKNNHVILIVVFISPKDLTVRLLEIYKVATPILQPV